VAPRNQGQKDGTIKSTRTNLKKKIKGVWPTHYKKAAISRWGREENPSPERTHRR